IARPVGNTWTNPTPEASVIVTFNTTADTPAVGTPPAPAATKVTTASAPGFPARVPTPERVSRTRVGVTGWNLDGPESVSAGWVDAAAEVIEPVAAAGPAVAVELASIALARAVKNVRRRISYPHWPATMMPLSRSGSRLIMSAREGREWRAR